MACRGFIMGDKTCSYYSCSHCGWMSTTVSLCHKLKNMKLYSCMFGVVTIACMVVCHVRLKKTLSSTLQAELVKQQTYYDEKTKPRFVTCLVWLVMQSQYDIN